MNAVILGYPRSGTTLVEFALWHFFPPVQTSKLHGHDLIRHDIKTIGKELNCVLILVIRDYRESIMSQLTRGDEQHEYGKIKHAFVEFMLALSAYDASEVHKMVVYYEDLISNTASVITDLGAFCGSSCGHITNNIEDFLEASRKDYTRRLGNPLTSGKVAKHFAPLTYEYPFDWQKEIRSLNETLYDKYLSRYGGVNE